LEKNIFGLPGFNGNGNTLDDGAPDPGSGFGLSDDMGLGGLTQIGPGMYVGGSGLAGLGGLLSMLLGDGPTVQQTADILAERADTTGNCPCGRVGCANNFAVAVALYDASGQSAEFTHEAFDDEDAIPAAKAAIAIADTVSEPNMPLAAVLDFLDMSGAPYGMDIAVSTVIAYRQRHPKVAANVVTEA
jgi:hypothetical protein